MPGDGPFQDLDRFDGGKTVVDCPLRHVLRQAGEQPIGAGGRHLCPGLQGAHHVMSTIFRCFASRSFSGLRLDRDGAAFRPTAPGTLAAGSASACISALRTGFVVSVRGVAGSRGSTSGHDHTQSVTGRYRSSAPPGQFKPLPVLQPARCCRCERNRSASRRLGHDQRQEQARINGMELLDQVLGENQVQGMGSRGRACWRGISSSGSASICHVRWTA